MAGWRGVGDEEATQLVAHKHECGTVQHDFVDLGHTQKIYVRFAIYAHALYLMLSMARLYAYSGSTSYGSSFFGFWKTTGA